MRDGSYLFVQLHTKHCQDKHLGGSLTALTINLKNLKRHRIQLSHSPMMLEYHGLIILCQSCLVSLKAPEHAKQDQRGDTSIGASGAGGAGSVLGPSGMALKIASCFGK